MLFFSLIAITGFRSCASGTSAGAGSVDNGIWILMIGGLITAAVISRDRPYLAWSLAAMAGLILIILIGKIDSVFNWAVVGLPLFAAAGIYGMIQIDATTNGRMKSFLGFSSGILIVAWMFLFYQEHQVSDMGIIGKAFFPTVEGLKNERLYGIFVLFLATFIFAVWKRSKIFYGISFFILLAFLGNGMIDEISYRFPKKLTPGVSDETKIASEKAWENFLKIISGEKAKTDAAEAAKAKLEADEIARKQRLEELRLQVEMQKKNPSTAHQGIAQPGGRSRIDRYIIPVNGNKPYSERIQVGEWKVHPRETRVREILETGTRATGGEMLVLQETTQCFFPPPGTREIILTRK
ncbi:MAG: hypothetical protein WA064_05370 [Candidatus Moraniibacteriota bacterium]